MEARDERAICVVERASSRGGRADGQPVKRSKPRVGHGERTIQTKLLKWQGLTRIGQCRYVIPVKELTLAAKAFADPTRVRILLVLRERELCVCELCDVLAVTQSTLSTHLQVIRDAGLVSSRKQGKWMYYAVEPSAERLLDSLFQFFSRSLKSDATLRQDGKKLKQRLSLRDNGSCCVGFGDAKTCCKKSAK
jgi:ArsR family transcriptional regulator